MDWYIKVLKNYVNFKGRARRAEYWNFFLFNALVNITLSLIDTFVLGAEGGTGILSGIYALAVLLPAIAVSIRRLHDIGRSGWWMFIALIPIIGIIIKLFWDFKDGEAGENKYGPNPKEIMA